MIPFKKKTPLQVALEQQLLSTISISRTRVFQKKDFKSRG